MSMDKKELTNLLQRKMPNMDQSEETYAQNEVITSLRKVIALVEIRESIDDLSANIIEVGKSIDDLRIMFLQTRSPLSFRIDDQGKDVRSAGIG